MRSTAAVDSRSSQNTTGTGESFAKLRAKALVDWQRGPSVPSMLIGSPSTISPMFSLAMMASSRSASVVNFLRAMVSMGVAIIRVRSLVATPMVLEPRSSPISRLSAEIAPMASRSVRSGVVIESLCLFLSVKQGPTQSLHHVEGLVRRPMMIKGLNHDRDLQRV